MKKIKITKEQHELAIKEAVSLSVNTGLTNGNINQAIQNTKRDAQKDGINPSRVGFNIPAEESTIITKKTIKEMRIKNILKNATIMTKKEISEKIKGTQKTNINETKQEEAQLFRQLNSSTEFQQIQQALDVSKRAMDDVVNKFFEFFKSQGQDVNSIKQIVKMFHLDEFIPQSKINEIEKAAKETDQQNKNIQKSVQQNNPNQKTEMEQSKSAPKGQPVRK